MSGALTSTLIKRSISILFSVLTTIIPTLLCCVFAGCGGGGSKPINSGGGVIAPSNLTYPQSSVVGTLGTAITPNVPTVNGTVTLFAASPDLPQGLTLDRLTGAISGTPTVESSQASYTITASNSGGSTSAVLKITIVLPPPKNLVYYEPIIVATVGKAMSATPSFTGWVSSYSVSPPLPSGVTLNAMTGSIKGIPTAPSPKTTYTITGSNSGGSTTAPVTITVIEAPKVLVELGHATTILALRMTDERVLSEDMSGHWTLWDYCTGKILARGDGALTWDAQRIDMAGPTFVISTDTQLQIYSASDGSALGAIPISPPYDYWVRLATDGSYVTTGSSTALKVWSTTGQPTLTLTGDYHSASVFAAPRQIQVANGPAGAFVIQTIALPGGSSAVTLQFSGAFNKWFSDGERFITELGNSISVYSKLGALDATATRVIPGSIVNGAGNWWWESLSSNGYIHPVSASSSQAIQVSGTMSGSGTNLFVVSGGYSLPIKVYDLSGASLIETDYALPTTLGKASVSIFAAVTPQKWVAGGTVLYDGASPADHTRYFGYGFVYAIAGASNLLAFETERGIHLIDPETGTEIDRIADYASQIDMSRDGTVLAAGSPSPQLSFPSPSTLNVYSIPSLSILASYYLPLQSFSLSTGGTVLAKVSWDGTVEHREVADISGSPLIWSDAGSGPVAISPDGTLFAAQYQGVSQIYRNGASVATVSGNSEGWIDDNRLLVAKISNLCLPRCQDRYDYSTIVNSFGETLVTFPRFTIDYSHAMEEMRRPQFTNSNSVYNGADKIYSLDDGSVLWRVADVYARGAIVGPYVVYRSGAQIFISRY